MLKWFYDLKLKWKLMLGFGLFIILIFGGSGIVSYYLLNQSLKDNAKETLRTVTTSIKSNFKSTFYTSLKNYLRAVAEKNKDIVNHCYQQYKQGKLTEDEAQNMARELLLAQKIGTSGYLYSINSEGKGTAHPKLPLGYDASRFPFVRKQIKMKHGFMKYMWATPGTNDKKKPKALYMTYFQPWDWIISASTYSEEFKQLVNIQDFREELLTIKIGKDGYGYVMDTKGNILIHPKLAQGISLANEKDINNQFIVEKMIKEEEGLIRYTWLDPQTKQTGLKLVYFNILPELDIIVAFGIYESELFSSLNKLEYILIGIGFAAVFIGFFIMIVLANISIKPLNKATYFLKLLSEGRGDLTKKINIYSKDEVGTLATHFNDFILFLNNIIRQIKQETFYTKEISTDLLRTSDESTKELDQMKTSVETVNEKIVHLDQEINQTNQSVDEVKDFLDHVVKLISSQASAINESSASIEQMSASIQNIAKVAANKLIQVHELEKIASNGEASMKEAVQIIKKVADSAHLIMDMITVINGIAEQTNLLAMNAAIEAAHAGDAGKGFAVVADEIRKLAEDTGKNSKEISNSLKEVISYIHVSEESTSKTGSVFVDIVKNVNEVANSMMEMKMATEEMAVGNEQVMKALNSLMQVSREVSDSSNEMEGKVSKIVTSTDNVRDISLDAKEFMENITVVVTSLYQTIARVSSAGLKNNDSVSKVENLVAQFIVDQSMPQALIDVQD